MYLSAKRTGSILSNMLWVGLAALAGCHHVLVPEAAIVPKKTKIHGVTLIDNYHWLRDRNNPKVIEHLRQENAYTAFMMKHTEALQEQLFQEMKSHIAASDTSAPVREDGYLYYTRTVSEKQYEILARRKDQPDSKEQILIDENLLAAKHDFFHLGAYDLSADQTLLAYSTDTTGSERYSLFVKNIKTGKLLPDRLHQISGYFTWANDNQTIYYVMQDETNRPYRLMRHQLGNDPKHDLMVYQEDDESFFLSVYKSRSKDFVFVSLESIDTDEVRFVDAKDPSQKLQFIQQRQQGLEYTVEHHRDYFYILTNDQAKNFRVVRAPIDNPSKDNWQEVVPHNPQVTIEDIDLFEKYMVLELREKGSTAIRVYDLPSMQSHTIKFDKTPHTVALGSNPEYQTDQLRIIYNTQTIPDRSYDYSLKTKELMLVKQQPVPNFSPDKYESQKIFAQAEDGTLIPILIVHKKGITNDGTHAVYLSGYGAYGTSNDPYFSSIRLSLLDRDVIVATAQIRGGGELGRDWYDAGRLLNKKNTFTDFIACAEHLLANGYAAAGRLAIIGGSAGGLLIGAVLNMRPDLFQAAVADVPFVDLINTMLDPSIPLTVTEYDEWGNPNQDKYFRYMLSYSPYDNVTKQDYPHLLVTSGLNDPRVGFWEPAKWVAKLRATKTDDHWLLFKINMDTGHKGASGRYDFLREYAFEYAFVLDRLGLSIPNQRS